MAEACAAVAELWPEASILRAVVYAHPSALAAGAVDLAARIYPGLHYLAWNWPNAGHGLACAFDFDGILCLDPPEGLDPGSEEYDRFILEAVPLYLPRRGPIPAIISARPERVRGLCLEWLERYGITAERLILRDGPSSLEGWSEERIARWKAERFLELDPRPALFAESSPAQAGVIALETLRPVICPAAGRVVVARPEPAELAELLERRRRCGWLSREGCRCRCERLARPVDTWLDCRRCAELPPASE
jgi:hypothetical protein